MTTTLERPTSDLTNALAEQPPENVPPSQPHRFARLVRGNDADPRWARPALIALLVVAAVLYLWGLGASGWANSFYAAAVQAGTKSWKAFFFGSFDSSNFITVDKPPASLWVMELSARIFGLSSWSMLVPEALEGVATVGILYATVKRWFGAGAGLLAGAVVMLTPVAALMFRFNNPDALLVLLLTGGAYAMTRALESGRTRWLVLAMSLVGTGFITKMLQAFLVLPAFGLVYLFAGPPKLGRRIWQLALSAVALVVSAGWWVAAVELTPASDRPYVGGSQDNNLFNLIFGYNGFGRVTGTENGSTANQWGATGWDRLFLPSFGSQISWLIPGALVLLIGALWFSRRGSRTDRTRAAVVLWGGWLVVTGLLLSYAKGIIHPYYTVALAPAIGAVIAIGAVTAWRHRSSFIGRFSLAAAVAATSIWAFVLLGRSSTWMPELRMIVLPVGLVAAAAIALATRRRLAAMIAAAALVVSLVGPAAYALDTAATTHSGSIPSAGPTQSGANGFGPGGGGGPGGGPGRGGRGGGPGGGFGGVAGAPTRGGNGTTGGRAAGGFPGGVGTPPTRTGSSSTTGRPTGGLGGPGKGTSGTGRPAANGAPTGMGTMGGGTSSVGGLLNSSTPSASLTKLLEVGASKYSWVLAVVGSNSASGYQLATGDPVMAIGGFNGTDPAPSLAQFEADVAAGKIHYFIAGGGGMGGGPGGGSSTSTASAITSWVEAHFTAKTVDGVTIYDLTSSK